jgi:hypothetical protein
MSASTTKKSSKKVLRRRASDDTGVFKLPKKGQPARRTEDKITKIGELAAYLIKDGRSTEEVLAMVKSRFPGCHTSVHSVAWYRSRLNRTGKV